MTIKRDSRNPNGIEIGNTVLTTVDNGSIFDVRGREGLAKEEPKVPCRIRKPDGTILSREFNQEAGAWEVKVLFSPHQERF